MHRILKYLTSNPKPEKGYIALTSAVIITILILTVVVAVSTTGFFGRFNILDTTLKEQSVTLAEACVEIAFLRIAQDLNYAGSEVVYIDEDSCTILPIQSSGSQRTIQTNAAKGESESNLEVVVETSDFSVVSWKEYASF